MKKLTQKKEETDKQTGNLQFFFKTGNGPKISGKRSINWEFTMFFKNRKLTQKLRKLTQKRGNRSTN